MHSRHSLGTLATLRTLLAVVVATVAFASCTSRPPSEVAGAPTRAPDESYETDGGLAHRVLVWHCDDRNERMAMVQTCTDGLFGCGAWTVDRTLCPAAPFGDRAATRTPAERAVEAGGRQRHAIPGGRGWR